MESNFITAIIDKDLEDGKISGVYTRFPPEPNGYLHIGHAKSICINFGMKDAYAGKCNLRFDDTNPTKEDVEYVDSIIEDIHWLGFDYDELHYASDYFDQLFEYAKLLIRKGLAYVDDLSAEEIRETRGTLTEKGKNSPFRKRSAEENMALFLEMREGKFKEGEKVLRAKIDMASPNLNLRDPVIYRILYAKHHRTGDKWCVYPMYDFTHPISDALEGITHSICTLEFEDHRPLYDWVLKACEFKNPPKQIEFARLNITNTIMSKRFLKRLVEEGRVDGWDDPRMPTICGIRRRGVPAEALVNFCRSVGVAKANSEVDARMLDHFAREYLNINAERAMAVFHPLKVVLTNLEAAEELPFEINPNEVPRRTRKVRLTRELYIDSSDFSENPPPKYFRLTPGGYVRLKAAYIIKCDEIVKDSEGNVSELRCSIVEGSKSGGDTSGIKCKGVVQWVSAECGKRFQFRHYDSLLDPDKAGEDFVDRLRDNSLTVFEGVGEPYLAEAEKGARFQFMRCGYFVKENADTFIEIVDLKDSYRP